MPLSLLFDEHASYHVMEGIIKRGVDALSVQQAGRRVTVQTGLNLMRQIDYKHETDCEFSRGFPGGVD